MTSYNLRKRTNPVSYGEEAASQLKLTDLAKVVRLPTGTTSVCFSAESVLAAKTVLDNPTSSPDKILGSLRQLSCLMVSKADLEVTGVAFSVRKLRKSEHLEIQRIASNLIDKWKRAILSEREALNNIAVAQQQQQQLQQRQQQGELQQQEQQRLHSQQQDLLQSRHSEPAPEQRIVLS